MKIGYARVSTLEQNLDLQIDALEKQDVKKSLQMKSVDLGPIESRLGLFVAMIKEPETGMPVELLQTTLSKQEAVKKYLDPLKNKNNP